MQARFVADAIAGKYPVVTAGQVAAMVDEAAGRCWQAPDPAALRALARPVGGVEDDILNQVVCLTFIERFGADPDLAHAPLAILHRLASASPAEATKRSTTAVKDYPGQLPTPLSEIDARFDELQMLVRSLAEAAIGATRTRSRLLAHVFAAIIRIHYYDDGNGRLARFVVQYLMRRWQGPIIVLPKVRNDPEWKSALEQGVAGNIEPLARQFAIRLRGQEGGEC